MKKKLLIGIDPGFTTGIGVWDGTKLTLVSSSNIITIMEKIQSLRKKHKVELWIEDARKRKWFGDDAEGKKQGAGSVKRDCAIWEEFAQHHEIPYKLFDPRHLPTKVGHREFTMITGWTGRTNEHARDAAMIVYNK